MIKSKKEYQTTLEWVDEMFEKKVKANSPEGEMLQVTLLLVKDYEDKNFQIQPPDPIAAIKLNMEERGLKNKDLVDKIGSKGYVSAILNGKKPSYSRVGENILSRIGDPSNSTARLAQVFINRCEQSTDNVIYLIQNKLFCSTLSFIGRTAIN